MFDQLSPFKRGDLCALGSNVDAHQETADRPSVASSTATSFQSLFVKGNRLANGNGFNRCGSLIATLTLSLATAAATTAPTAPSALTASTAALLVALLVAASPTGRVWFRVCRRGTAIPDLRSRTRITNLWFS